MIHFGLFSDLSPSKHFPWQPFESFWQPQGYQLERGGKKKKKRRKLLNNQEMILTWRKQRKKKNNRNLMNSKHFFFSCIKTNISFMNRRIKQVS